MRLSYIARSILMSQQISINSTEFCLYRKFIIGKWEFLQFHFGALKVHISLGKFFICADLASLILVLVLMCSLVSRFRKILCCGKFLLTPSENWKSIRKLLVSSSTIPRQEREEKTMKNSWFWIYFPTISFSLFYWLIYFLFLSFFSPLEGSSESTTKKNSKDILERQIESFKRLWMMWSWWSRQISIFFALSFIKIFSCVNIFFSPFFSILSWENFYEKFELFFSHANFYTKIRIEKKSLEPVEILKLNCGFHYFFFHQRAFLISLVAFLPQKRQLIHLE